MALRVEHDPEANALYVYFSDEPYLFGEDIDHERRIDYSIDMMPIGIEFTCVSTGVNLEGVPRADEVAEALRQYGIQVYA